MMNRRAFIARIGAGLVIVPYILGAGPVKVARIGWLHPRSAASAQNLVDAFRQGLRENGWIEGQNIVIEYRFAGGNYRRLPELAIELVKLEVDVIVTGGTPATRAAKDATAAIPIVMGTATNPVGSGFVASLTRPGANITGLSTTAEDVSPKSLEFLVATVPGADRIAVLSNPSNPSNTGVSRSLQAMAQDLGVRLLPVHARTPDDIQSAFAVMAREGAQALIVLPDSLLIEEGGPIAELAAETRLPAIYPFREHVDAGGLMSYGQNLADNYRRAATFVDKILRGARPADLPVEQSIKFELVINLRAARALGITIPESVLMRADKVIE